MWAMLYLGKYIMADIAKKTIMIILYETDAFSFSNLRIFQWLITITQQNYGNCFLFFF